MSAGRGCGKQVQVGGFGDWLTEWSERGPWQLCTTEVGMLIDEISRLRHALGQPVPYTITIDDREVEVPCGAVAWRRALSRPRTSGRASLPDRGDPLAPQTSVPPCHPRAR